MTRLFQQDIVFAIGYDSPAISSAYGTDTIELRTSIEREGIHYEVVYCRMCSLFHEESIFGEIFAKRERTDLPQIVIIKTPVEEGSPALLGPGTNMTFEWSASSNLKVDFNRWGTTVLMLKRDHIDAAPYVDWKKFEKRLEFEFVSKNGHMYRVVHKGKYIEIDDPLVRIRNDGDLTSYSKGQFFPRVCGNGVYQGGYWMIIDEESLRLVQDTPHTAGLLRPGQFLIVKTKHGYRKDGSIDFNQVSQQVRLKAYLIVEPLSRSNIG